MVFKTYNNPEYINLKLLFLSLLILPFQTFLSILILLFISYKSWQNNYKRIICHHLSYSLFGLTCLMIISCLLLIILGRHG